ncbi:MAG: SRPBCC family protein [Pseudomonadota bacterium]
MSKKLLFRFAMLLAILVAGVLIRAAMKPDQFAVVRRTVISAPPEKIYPLLQDFHRWAEWSPWEKLDPAMVRTFGGAQAGKGATYAWKGNKDLGEGRMEIVGTDAPQTLDIKLDFIEPMQATNATRFILRHAPSGGTEVIWIMRGPADFPTKLMDTVVGMDRMVGKDFEAGLANLKVAAER